MQLKQNLILQIKWEYSILQALMLVISFQGRLGKMYLILN